MPRFDGIPVDDAAPDSADAPKPRFAGVPIDDEIRAKGKTVAERAAPRFDFIGDTGKAAASSAAALKEDASKAFPSNEAAKAKIDQNRADYGLIGGFLKSGLVDPVVRAGNALKIPLDAAGVALSPVTGAIHAGAGSLLSYALPGGGVLPAGKSGDDPKKTADEMIDKAMLGLGPRGMGGGTVGVEAAAQETNALRAARSDASLTNKAVEKVNERAKADQLTAQGVLDAQKSAAETGDKITLMDLGKKNVKGLAGSVFRAPGEAAGELDRFLDNRVKDAGPALKKDIEGIAKGSSYDTIQSLFEARSKAARPLFEEALSSESVAPFEKQFESHFADATKATSDAEKAVKNARNQVTLSEAKAATTSDVYSAPTPKSRRFAKDKLIEAENALADAKANEEAIRQKLQRAQSDKSAGAPGAVWSPRLQEFLADPDIQSGIRRGIRLEKKDAITESRPFKNSDFSIVGETPEGEPVLGEVPTMKSLAVAKEGLDARIAELKDPTTGRPTKEGVTLKRLRDGFVSELDALNPKYKVARDAWAGPSQSVEAVSEGRKHFSRAETSSEIKAEFDKLSPSEKEFYRLGAAEAKIDAVKSAADAGDKSKRVINSDRDRERFRILFDSDAQAQKFIDSVERKRIAFETRQKIKGGSDTAERTAEDMAGPTAALHGAHALAHAAGGNVLGTIAAALRAKKDLGLIPNPRLNSEIARLLSDPNLQINPSSGLNLLQRVPLPHTQGLLQRGGVNALRAIPLAPGQAPQPPRQ